MAIVSSKIGRSDPDRQPSSGNNRAVDAAPLPEELSSLRDDR